MPVDFAAALPFILFAIATFLGAVVAGIAGFAFGVIAAGMWLHVLTPLQSATLVVAFGFLIQGLAVWRLRQALALKRLWPFVLGGALGVPLGIELLRWLPVEPIRAGIGVFLILYSLYSLLRPKLASMAAAGPWADGGIGVAGGLLGGSTGFSAILPTIWVGLRGWTKDEQRATFQPVAVAIHGLVLLWAGSVGAIDGATVQLFLIGLPAVILGTWLGLRLYGRLDEAGFRKTVLGFLLVSGIALVV